MRALAVAFCSVVVVAGMLGPPASAAAVRAETQPDPPCSWLDFGRGLVDSAALGSPRRSVGGVPRSGAVEVRPRPWTADQPPMVLTATSVGLQSAPGTRFGAAVVGAHVSYPDYCVDLVIGAPGADGGRGAVVIVPDLGSDFDTSRAVRLPTAGLGLGPGDALGTALGVVQSSNGTLIVAGAPGHDLPGAPNAGALVSWLVPADWGSPGAAPATASVPTPDAPTTYVQGSDGVLGHAERADRFGSVIASDPVMAYFGPGTLVVGIPKEDIGHRTNAGAVALMTFTGGRLTSNELLWQGHGLPGRSRTGDRLGAAVVPGGFGLPGKDVHGRRDAGSVIVWQRDAAEPTTGAYRVITQDTAGVPDRSEKGDRFGSALAAGSGMAGPQTFTYAVGVPGEDSGRRRNVGAVTWLTWMGEETPPRWSFSALRVFGLRRGDAFGSRLVVVNDEPDMEESARDTLFVGAPGEDRPGARNAGRYYVTTYPNRVPTAVAYADGLTPNERFGG